MTLACHTPGYTGNDVITASSYTVYSNIHAPSGTMATVTGVLVMVVMTVMTVMRVMVRVVMAVRMDYPPSTSITRMTPYLELYESL